LNDIASTVARELPNGEKNKLRKTYKGKIKDLGISGKFDVAVRNDDAPDSFMAMLRQPEEEWAIQNRVGKEIENGLSALVRTNLLAGMTMSKGAIPKSSWDSAVLGELDIAETKATPVPTPTKPLVTGTANKGLNPPISQQPRIGKAEIARPKRNVKKRGYEESSFEGYGEGYVDDDMADAGYSTGEGDDRGLSQKRRKKVGSHEGTNANLTNLFQTAPSHGYPGQMRQSSYGPGMVGA
jgi:Rox3 mediator complex subunit